MGVYVDMKPLRLLVAVLVIPGVSAAQGLQSSTAPEARAADVTSPRAIVNAAYAALARAPGEPFQWDRFRSLFVDGATLIPNTEQAAAATPIHSPETFIDTVDRWYAENAPIGGPKDKGFTEEAIHNEVLRYGDVAQVFSSYQKRRWNDEEILGRGINSFQLVYRHDRWWIVSIVWDEEVGAGPIPKRFLE